MRPLLLLSTVALLAGGCRSRSAPVHYIDRVEVSGVGAQRNALLALEPAELRGLVEQRLSKPSFIRLEQGKAAPDDARVYVAALELAFVREASRPEQDGSWAEVGAMLSLRPTETAPQTLRAYEFAALSDEPITEGTPDGRQEAARQALEEVLGALVDEGRIHLNAVQKKDEELVKELASDDARVRRSALQVLATRRHPAAGPELIKQLTSEDLTEVRAAMGALVEMREQRAISMLIDLGGGRDPGFERELLFAIGDIGGEEAQAYLFTVAQGHDHPAVRAAAREAFDQLQTR